MRFDFNFDRLGEWTDERAFEVTKQHAKAYAEATGDSNPRHTAGELAPPIFAVVPTNGVVLEALEQLTQFWVGNLPTVHGEQDMYFDHPLMPPAIVRSRAAPVGVHVKPTGTTVVVLTETRNEEGQVINRQYLTEFMRGVDAGKSAGDEPPSHRLPESLNEADAVARITYPIDRDQTIRYADAADDHHPFHLDEEVAKTAGFPGIIVHGLCTMAFSSRAIIEAVCDADPERLKRLAVRFSRPVAPGQKITTSVWRLKESDSRDMFGFEVQDATGQTVIRNGRAEVAR